MGWPLAGGVLVVSTFSQWNRPVLDVGLSLSAAKAALRLVSSARSELGHTVRVPYRHLTSSNRTLGLMPDSGPASGPNGLQRLAW